jgi:Flp pilus assembly pilin Flp
VGIVYDALLYQKVGTTFCFSEDLPIRSIGVDMNAKNFFKNLWNDQRGQSTTEYILILSVVVMIAMKFKTVFGTKLDQIVTKLGGEIDTASSSQ